MSALVAAPYKRKEGWKAEDMIPLADKGEDGKQKMLRISSYKHSRGGIVTYAGSCVKDGMFTTTAIFQDFHVMVEWDQTARCTEKSITAQHQRALDMVEDIKGRALAHLAAKAQEMAA